MDPTTLWTGDRRGYAAFGISFQSMHQQPVKMIAVHMVRWLAAALRRSRKRGHLVGGGIRLKRRPAPNVACTLRSRAQSDFRYARVVRTIRHPGHAAAATGRKGRPNSPRTTQAVSPQRAGGNPRAVLRRRVVLLRLTWPMEGVCRRRRSWRRSLAQGLSIRCASTLLNTASAPWRDSGATAWRRRRCARRSASKRGIVAP